MEVSLLSLLTLLSQVVVPPTVPMELLSFLFFLNLLLFIIREGSADNLELIDLEVLYLLRALWKLQQYEGMGGAAIDFLLFRFDSLSTITVSCERIPGRGGW